MEFIDDNKEEFGVEPIVRVLKDTPARIATSSYYAYKNRPPSDRDLRDERLMVVIDQIFTDNYSVYGARKMWHALNRDHAGEFGHVARCTVERLMKQMGIRGLNRRRKRPATKSAAAEECPDDQVNRDFSAEAPNCLWVADITYISTAAGWVYAAFILDVFSREIVGWQVTNHLRESLATDALNMALSARYRAGEDVTGLVHHSDRGVQGGFNWLSQHLDEKGVSRWLPRTGVRRPVTCPQRCVGSGVRIGPCGHRCAPLGARHPRGRCSVSSGR